MIGSYIGALIFGIMFGFALNKGGLTKYTNISGAFRFTNMTVLKFMLTAMATAMVGLYILKTLGVITFPNIPATYIIGNALGGLVFGVGMSLAGYCPGTCAAGSGEGRMDYLVSGLLGLIAGSVLFGFTYNLVFTKIAGVLRLGNVTLPDILSVNPLLMVAVFVGLTLILFYLIDHGLIRKDKTEDK